MGQVMVYSRAVVEATGDADFETSLEKNNLQKPIKNSVATYTGSVADTRFR